MAAPKSERSVKADPSPTDHPGEASRILRPAHFPSEAGHGNVRRPLSGRAIAPL
jgi:hypothetical protein